MASRVALAVRALPAFPVSVMKAAGAGLGEFVAQDGLGGQKTLMAQRTLPAADFWRSPRVRLTMASAFFMASVMASSLPSLRAWAAQPSA